MKLMSEFQRPITLMEDVKMQKCVLVGGGDVGQKTSVATLFQTCSALASYLPLLQESITCRCSGTVNTVFCKLAVTCKRVQELIRVKL